MSRDAAQLRCLQDQLNILSERLAKLEFAVIRLQGKPKPEKPKE